MLLTCTLMSAAPPRPLATGVISYARGAQVGDVNASAGTTLYDGDRLSTDEQGWLRAGTPGYQLQLRPRTAVTLREFSADGRGGALIEMAVGAIDLSATRTTPLAVLVQGARFTSVADKPIVATIEIRGAREIHVYVKRGTLNLQYQAETAVLAESRSYALLLDPTDREIALAQTLGDSRNVKKSSVRRPVFLLILIAAAVGVSIPVLMHSPESPHTISQDRH
jgi:hypothetical protein